MSGAENKVKSERNLTVTLHLTEQQAQDVFIHMTPKYHPNSCDQIKKAIVQCLRYTPSDVDI